MDLVQVLAEDWGALRYLAGFVLLPFLYLRDSAEVHKQYYEANCKLSALPEDERKALLESMSQRLHVFSLEWWLIGAWTVMLLSVFGLGEVVTFSGWLGNGASPGGGVVAKGIVNAYGFGLAVLTMLFVHWMKTEAFRTLHGVGMALARAPGAKA